MTAYQHQPRPPTPLRQRGGNVIWPTLNEQGGPAGAVHYAVNMFPVLPQNPESPWVQRGGIANRGTGTAAGSAVVAMGQLPLPSGSELTWLLSSSSGIWTYDWAAQTYTNTVTAANLATASVTMAAVPHLWCIFAGKLVFTDGVNTPWTWDGTAGAGGVVELTNAPIAYGRPTVYYAKLFFIKNTERDTIVWSEENTANTGYEAGGFSNVWRLAQTGTSPLYALAGTNEALYYWRQHSIGLIRGSVGPNFVTSGTHDAVAGSSGTIYTNMHVVADDAVWYLDASGMPMVLPFGGAPVRVWGEGLIGDPLSVGVAAPLTNAPSQAVAVAGLLGEMLLGRTIWFGVGMSAGTGFTVYGAIVCDVESRRVIGLVVPNIGANMKPTMGLIRNTAAGLPMEPAFVDAATGRLMHYVNQTRNVDRNASSVAQSTTYQMIGAPLGTSDALEYQFDQLDVVYTGDMTTTNLAIQCLTSRRPSAATISAAQNVSVNIGGVITHARVGLDQSGRWLRPCFKVTSTQDNGVGRLMIQSWSVLAFPISAFAGTA